MLAPRGTPHAYGNAGDGPARYLLITTPRILELVEALHKPPGNGPSHYAAIFRQYDSELLTG